MSLIKKIEFAQHVLLVYQESRIILLKFIT